MAPSSEGNRIVHQGAGALTGETLYRTADGRWWTSEVEEGTGVTLGVVRGGRVEERSHG